MELLKNDRFTAEGLFFKRVDPFKHFGTTIKSNSDWNVEIVNRMHKTEKAYYALLKIFKSKLFSIRTKLLRLYTAVVRPILTYGCEVCSVTAQMEKKSLSVKIKKLKISGSLYDDKLGCWQRRRTNAEFAQSPKVTNYTKRHNDNKMFRTRCVK